MPNQTVNKVQFGGQTVIDITDTTADAADVIEGEVFYSKSGARSVGSLGDATQSTHGLMSVADKTKLDNLTGNVYGDYTITIHVSDWTLSNNIYTYTWYHSSITYQCLVDILLITQPETVLTGVLSYDKVTGGVQFTSTTLPIGDISLKVRIIDSDTTWVIQQQNAFIDIDTTLQASSWSNSSPYIQTWTNDKITDTCDVKIKFLEGALAANQLYIGYEKVSGGLQFTAPTKPTVNIPIRIHIINADPTAMENLDAEMVSTDAISGAVNVQEALEALDNNIITVNNKIGNLNFIEFELNTNSNKTILFSDRYTGFLTARARSGGEHYCYYISGYGMTSIRQNYTAIAANSSYIALSYGNDQNMIITNSSTTASFQIGILMLCGSITSIT